MWTYRMAPETLSGSSWLVSGQKGETGIQGTLRPPLHTWPGHFLLGLPCWFLSSFQGTSFGL